MNATKQELYVSSKNTTIFYTGYPHYIRLFLEPPLGKQMKKMLDSNKLGDIIWKFTRLLSIKETVRGITSKGSLLR